MYIATVFSTFKVRQLFSQAELVAISSSLRARSGVHPGQVANPSYRSMISISFHKLYCALKVMLAQAISKNNLETPQSSRHAVDKSCHLPRPTNKRDARSLET
ncbi:hypothetical protein AMECASPLE_021183 [Ameca splendens]|uniref:Uncharacterized protein n=1 Tax=Ameca splendens TaxID=208324 RepID=A0ABV0YQU0_9TELE